MKIVDDVLFSGPLQTLHDILGKIKKSCDLGTIVYGPDCFQFYGLTINQEDDFSVSIHGDTKFEPYEAYQITRIRRKQSDEDLNTVELKSYKSLNSAPVWLGIADSPFCALVSSYMQQKGPQTTVNDLVTQGNILRALKELGSTVRFKRP